MDRLGFQVEIEKRQTEFTVRKMKIVQTVLLTHQHLNYNWIISPADTNTRCSDKQEFSIDKGSESIIIEDGLVDSDFKHD